MLISRTLLTVVATTALSLFAAISQAAESNDGPPLPRTASARGTSLYVVFDTPETNSNLTKLVINEESAALMYAEMTDIAEVTPVDLKTKKPGKLNLAELPRKEGKSVVCFKFPQENADKTDWKLNSKGEIEFKYACELDMNSKTGEVNENNLHD